MSTADTSEREHGGDDIVAAEYVLGVLPSEERGTAARRIDAEPGFARLVDSWEVRFAPMASAYEPVDPPASVKPAIDRRLAGAAAPAAARPGMWASLAFWRGLAVAALAALALWIVVPYVIAPEQQPQQLRLVASLAPHDSDVHYFVVFDARTADVGLSHVTGARADGRDFELWLIEGDKAPESIGVIPVGASVHLAVSQALVDRFSSGAVLAISMEPAGGSPTGEPTGPVVASGDLKTI
ncbi:MAG: anti-sigma factor [Rhizobiaceae bacterium]|nr:anti-sigma factor [Rhizobiaceae bacterium]